MNKPLQLFQVWRFILQMLNVQQDLNQGPGGHFRTVQCWVQSHSCVFLAVSFESLSCWRTEDLRWDKAFWHWAAHFFPECIDSLEIYLYSAQIQDTWCQTQQSKTKSSLFHVPLWLQSYFLDHFWICDHWADGTCCQIQYLQFCLIYPKGHLAEALWKLNMHFGKFQSGFLWFGIFSRSISDGWFSLTDEP